MNEHELEAYLVVSRPEHKTYSLFTTSVLNAIRLGDEHKLAYEKPSIWQSIRSITWRSAPRRAVALSLVLAVAAMLGFSGYAYAKGTNPLSLIKRIVIGNEVKVTYQTPNGQKPREFTYGSKRSYSDIAVSAFAEINMIDLLHFHAANAYTVPKDGVEYITDPFRVDFIAPRIGTVEQVTGENVVLHLTYSMGRSKYETSQDIDQHITIPRAEFYYYKEGKKAEIQADAVGKLVAVYQDDYLRHIQHSGQRPAPVDLFSVFALSHPYEAIKEATATKGPINTKADQQQQDEISQMDISEFGLGAWAQVCMGNGADTCPNAFRDDKSGQSFYAGNIYPGQHKGQMHGNPNMMPTGEGVAVPTAETRQYQWRNIEGKIVKIQDDKITIKTSSGQLWTFQYAVAYQKAFADFYKQPLKEGQLLGGAVLSSVYDWDRRNFDDKYVADMYRYE